MQKGRWGSGREGGKVQLVCVYDKGKCGGVGEYNKFSIFSFFFLVDWASLTQPVAGAPSILIPVQFVVAVPFQPEAWGSVVRDSRVFLQFFLTLSRGQDAAF